MSNIPEAEVLDNDSVIIWNYHGKSVLIPADVIKRVANPKLQSDETIKEIDYKRKIALTPRRFVDGGL